MVAISTASVPLATLGFPFCQGFSVGIKQESILNPRHRKLKCILSSKTATPEIDIGTQHYIKKDKVVFILGATGTGKSRLSIDLANHFKGEIINSDKMQVYKGLDIVTNRILEEERQGVPHHLLSFVEPEADFTTQQFYECANAALNHIIEKCCLPIIVGGSNTYIRALVEDPSFNFRAKYDCCFLWMDVALPVLHNYLAKRIDRMLDRGMIDEVRGMFVPCADYTRGVWRVIGARELDQYFRAEKDMVDETTKNILLDNAIKEMKQNTYKLVNTQLRKIKSFKKELGWTLHRVDATSVFETSGQESKDAWEKDVFGHALAIVGDFLQ